MTEQEGGEQHWLQLAKDARAQAARLGDLYSIRTLLLIAQRYEALAERARRQGPEAGDSECA